MDYLDHPDDSTFSIEDLVGSKICTAEGKRIGHVVDVQVAGGPMPRVCGLIFGEYGWLYRLHVLEPITKKLGIQVQPHIIPWDAVAHFASETVTLKPGRDEEAHQYEPPLRGMRKRSALA